MLSCREQDYNHIISRLTDGRTQKIVRLLAGRAADKSASRVEPVDGNTSANTIKCQSGRFYFDFLDMCSFMSFYMSIAQWVGGEFET